jgi:predicted polyphosphate/ATP-dependent NAD kinase
MHSVGIIVNPDSGRDVRRIISQALTVNNEQKVNILARLLVALEAMGVGRVEIMPDRFGIGSRALDLLGGCSAARLGSVIDMPTTWGAGDTLRAAALMRDHGVGCIVVLGGDGTCRLVAKTCGDVPLLAISTGTNNVVPEFVEGTIAGLAAGCVALHPDQREALCWRHKRLLISVADKSADVGLVDVALLEQAHVGSRAVWDVSQLRQLFVTRSHATRIGLSSVLGMLYPIATSAPYGAVVSLNNGHGERVRAPVMPGRFASLIVGEPIMMQPGGIYPVQPIRPAVLALDGEREIVLGVGVEAHVMLDLEGPWIVDVEKALAQAAADRVLFDRNQ